MKHKQNKQDYFKFTVTARSFRKRKNSDIDIVQATTTTIQESFRILPIISEMSITFIFRPQDKAQIME